MKKQFSIFNSQFSITKGFTLIELLVVIGLIGILSSWFVVNFLNSQMRGRDQVRKNDLHQLQNALETYRTNYGVYPTFAVSAPPGAVGWAFPSGLLNFSSYMPTIPHDPTITDACNPSPSIKNDYLYVHDSTHMKYTLFATLENLNDSEAKGAKPNPLLMSGFPGGSACILSSGSINNGNPTCVSVKIGSGTCSNSIFNFWLSNPN